MKTRLMNMYTYLGVGLIFNNKDLFWPLLAGIEAAGNVFITICQIRSSISFNRNWSPSLSFFSQKGRCKCSRI